jgi:tetratricopeptide (TPR) repeat protein
VRDVWNPATMLVQLKSLKFDQRRILDLRRHFICSCTILIVFASASVQTRAQDADHAGHAPSQPVPREILDRPVTLRSGVGTVHDKVSTSSPGAQSFYDQGLAYLHSFVWIEAIRSFHQSLRSDPNLVMAYLGLADAYIGLQDVATARSAVETAKTFEKKMNDRERAWLNIRGAEVAFLEDGGNSDAYVAYRKSVSDALKKNPNDPWLWIQRGLADEASPLTHGQAGGVDTLAFYKTALALAPENLPALHYYAHTCEGMGRIKEALDLTATYARRAPAIPHAHHMHGHELLRSGRTEEAIEEFLKTKELEDNYYRVEKIPAQYDWHHAHNLQLLAMAYESLGQMKSAAKLFQEVFAAPAYTEFLEYNRRAWPEYLINRSRYDEALEAARELANSPWPMARVAGHSLAGQALLALNRSNDAKDEFNAAERESESLPPRIAAALPYPTVLRAEILLRENHIQDAEGLWFDVEKSMLAMPGPDAWSSATFQLETIAQRARDAGDWELAGFTARNMMEHNPGYAGGYYAMALVARHTHDPSAEAQLLASAQKLWSKADPDLPELLASQKKAD